MASVQVVGTGIVCRNPLPHLMSRHAYFPSIVELEPNVLFAAMDIGSAFEAVDVRSYGARSTDGGQTWTRPRLLFEPDESRHPVSTTCRVSRAPDGRLIGAVSLMDRRRRDFGLANPKTDGFVRTELALIESKDDGRTWSAPRVIDPPIDRRTG